MRGHADDWHHVGVGVAVLAVAIVAVVDGNTSATVADTSAVAEDVVAGGRLRVAVTQAGIDDDVAQFALVVALFHDAAAVVVHVVVVRCRR